MTKFYPATRNQVVLTAQNVSLLLAGDVTLFTPPPAGLRFIPSVIFIDNVKVSGTLSTAPAVTIDDGTNGNDIIAATTLTSPVTGKSWRLTPPATQVNVVTGNKVVRLRKSTLGVGQATTFRERVEGIAKITTAAAHGFAVGDKIVVASLGGTGYNGSVTVLAVPTTTTFQFASAGLNEASTADTAGRVGNYIVNVTLIGVA